MTKLNHVPHRTLHTLLQDVEEFEIYWKAYNENSLFALLDKLKQNKLNHHLQMLNYLETINLVFNRVLNEEVNLISFIRFITAYYNNQIPGTEAEYYYNKLIEHFGEEFIYNKLEKINRFGMDRLLIQPFNDNHLDPRVWWNQYWIQYYNNQRPPINRKMRPYATTHNWGWYITPREKRKGLYKKRYRQKLKTELNKELDEYFTNTH